MHFFVQHYVLVPLRQLGVDKPRDPPLVPVRQGGGFPPAVCPGQVRPEVSSSAGKGNPAVQALTRGALLQVRKESGDDDPVPLHLRGRIDPPAKYDLHAVVSPAGKDAGADTLDPLQFSYMLHPLAENDRDALFVLMICYDREGLPSASGRAKGQFLFQRCSFLPVCVRKFRGIRSSDPCLKSHS